MKTILKLYQNGDVETIDTPLKTHNPFEHMTAIPGYIEDNGLIVNTNRDITSDFIDVIGGDDYRIVATWEKQSVSYYWLRIAYYSSNFTHIGFGYEHYNENTNNFTHDFVCPANVAYVRISMNIGTSLMFRRRDDAENKISFSEKAIQAPKIIEYPPDNVRNYYINKTSVSGYIYQEYETVAPGLVNPPNEHDRTSDFIDVRGWGNFAVRGVFENLDGSYHVWVCILAYNASKQYTGLIFEDYVTWKERTGTFIYEQSFYTTASYIRITTTYYDHPTANVKMSVQRGTTATQKHYLAPEDLPSWAINTGHPVSIFKEGIVIKGNLIQS